jgi:ABC-type transport system substrate-binding protein
MSADFATTRRMNIDLLDTFTFQEPAPQNPTLRAAVRFTMNEPFALFYESTMAVGLWPEHVWINKGQAGSATDIHGDFGCLVYPATASGSYTDTTKKGTGIPPSATDLPAGCTKPFDYPAAEAWDPADEYVIGMGPFTFDTWSLGSFAKVDRYDNFFIGTDPVTGVVIDADIATYMKLPDITSILFRIYRSTTLGVLALGRGEIDFYHWNIPAEFVPDMLGNPNIAVEANPEPGFFYMAYNMRRSPWGYSGTTDVGLQYRTAVSHLVDKKSIVQNLLQNFGVIGHGTISPANTFWYNELIPKPPFDKALAASILDAAGWGPDPAGDCTKETPGGCRSLPGIGTRLTEILTPQADYDPVRAAAGQMIADSMRSVGLNFVSTPLAFGQIVARLDARDFDQYILGWRIGGTDPDYLFSFFHSSNALGGQNYPGYDDPEFDQIIEDSRAELNRTLRQELIRDAQINLATNRPYEVLYYRTNIEGYRQDRWVGWTVSSGTIWNFYSLLQIHHPSNQRLVITPTLQSAVSSEGTAPVTVTVFDQDRNPVSGATVRLQLQAPNAGTLSSGAITGVVDMNLTTDSSGQVLANFAAPLVPGPAPVTVLIDLTASKQPAFPDEQKRVAQITVFPVGAQFLSVQYTLPGGDVAEAGGTLLLEIEVRDQAGLLANDATVTVDSTLVVTPSNGTASALATVTLKAPANVTAETSYDLTVTATKPGYADGQQELTVTVLPKAVQPCAPGEVRDASGNCIKGTSIPGPEIVLLIALVGVIGVAVAVRRRRAT